jgi:hypothetical protein
MNKVKNALIIIGLIIIGATIYFIIRQRNLEDRREQYQQASERHDQLMERFIHASDSVSIAHLKHQLDSSSLVLINLAKGLK